MKVNPKALTIREELNLRQGIKSSLPNMEQLIASIFTLFKISDSSDLKYTEEYSNQGKTAIKLIDNLEQPLIAFFQNQLTSSSMNQTDLLTNFNKIPLFTAQLESLQVVIQLFWKLGEINFVRDMASSTERKERHRYNKSIIFSTNLDIIESVITDKDGNFEEETKNLLFNYINNASLTTNNIESKLIKLLTVFSEDTQFKIRDNSSNEIFFQQEGIYSEIIANNNVVNKDPNEDVGPFRILKTAVKENLNYYLESNNTDGFKLKTSVSNSELESYLIRVNSHLNLNPKTTKFDIIEDLKVTDVDVTEDNAIQKIFYGAPGTGKSHKVEELTKKPKKEGRMQRITFHPEFDYASFIGGYKPTMADEDGKEVIKYKFVPQAFTNIYVKAWNDPNNDYYLVIEEINRGNCAEIFGDIFQLLDRDSDYDITPSIELKSYLKSVLTDENNGLEDGKLKLPKNLTIYATMNTSDQSLFPMDSAFKRRWDWEYIPICYEEKTVEGKPNPSFDYVVDLENETSFRWNDFITNINKNHIEQNEVLGMDKCLGNYFVKPKKGETTIDVANFINKAIFYLWNDVFKDEKNQVFYDEDGKLVSYESFFPIKPDGVKKLEALVKRIGVNISNSQTNEEEKEDLETSN